jgi:isoleucyl-tRNA synthetase
MSKQKVNSVHLQNFPDVSKIDSNSSLVQEMDKVRDICSVALAIRDKKNLRVRLPLNSLKIVGKNIKGLKKYKNIIQEEVNVKNIEFDEEIGNLAEFKIQIDFKKLGAKLGKKIQEISKAAKAGEWEDLGVGKIKLGGEILEKNEYEIKLSPKDNDSTSAISTNDAIVILDTNITKELEIEGLARDLVRMIQQFRRESGFNVSDRVKIMIYTNYDKLKTAIQKHSSYIKEQTLGTSIILAKEKDIKTGHLLTTTLDEKDIVIGLDIVN